MDIAKIGRRLGRIALWSLLIAAILVASGWLLGDRLMPRASGAPAHALPIHPGQTALDRELEPLLEQHPGQNGVLIVPDGTDAFAARAIASRQAGRSLDLQYFIWHDDLAGRLLAREAWQAAERGVRVRMLLDDINAQGNDNRLMVLDAHPNIEVRLYNPLRNRTGPLRVIEMLQRVTSMNHRMHNKAWIADGRVAIVGGRNISDQYFDNDGQQNFRDLDAVVFGPVVAQAEDIFDSFWNSSAAIPLSALGKAKAPDIAAMRQRLADDLENPVARAYLSRSASTPRVAQYLTDGLAPHWTSDLAIVSDPPVKWRDSKREGWMVDRIADQLRQTRRQALIVSPYFVPGDLMTREMVAARAHGIQLGVVTNSLATNDVVGVYSGYSSYRDALLRAGVWVHELKLKANHPSPQFGGSKASLHTKAYEIDGEQGFIGSFNLDPRSAHLNTEMGLVFHDAGIAADIRREYLRLSSPELSDWVYLDARGDTHWLDRSVAPPRIADSEPDTTPWLRAKAAILRRLPVESQF